MQRGITNQNPSKKMPDGAPHLQRSSAHGCQQKMADLATWQSVRVFRHAVVAVAVLGMRRKLI